MSVVPSEEIERRRMSWEEFSELPESPRAEWVDGEVLVMTPVSGPHGVTTLKLGALLLEHLSGVEVGTEIGVALPHNRLRGPDLVVAEQMPERGWVVEPPLVVVEVVSASTRAEDTLRKPMEYAEGGIGQYWIVDPELRTIEVLRNNAGAWDVSFHLDDQHPAAEVVVGGHGTIPLDLTALLGPPPE